MGRPDSLRQQYVGKAEAEIARGMGVVNHQPHAVALEPPWEAFDRDEVNLFDCYVNDWEGPFDPSSFSLPFFGRRGAPKLYTPGCAIVLPEVPLEANFALGSVEVQPYAGDDDSLGRFVQLLTSLRLAHPLSFELIGLGAHSPSDKPKVRELVDQGVPIMDAIRRAPRHKVPPFVGLYFVTHRGEVGQVESRLRSYYPNAGLVVRDHPPEDAFERGIWVKEGHPRRLYLECGYVCPLKPVSKLDPDPLQAALGAMDRLGEDDWAWLQVLFSPATKPWRETVTEAVRDPFKKDYLLAGLTDVMLREKLDKPLYAASVRVASNRLDVTEELLGWARQFDKPPQRFLTLNPADLGRDEDRESWKEDLGSEFDYRYTHTPGLLLNLDELASLVHLPAHSVSSDRLRRVRQVTKAAPPVDDARAVVLGENVHRGARQPALVPAELRFQHCYVAGASGTGKSTLLLNLILQDLESGQGVGLLDPHGDLVTDVLARIPEHRVDDVVYFDATDEEYPFGLNILQGRDRKERERVVAEVVSTIHRFFPDSWGPRLEHVLTHALDTIARASDGNLRHVRQLLTDDDFRDRIVSKLTDPDLLAFWTNEYPRLPKDAADPILNKLGKFLGPTVTRNIVCQKSTVDFDEVLNRRKVFLAKIPAATVGQGVAGVLGTFLVAKIVGAAFRREPIPREQRVPFYLYVDEFQNFANLATVRFDTVMVEARKYKLSLTLANQFVAQVPPEVRAAIFNSAGTLVSFRVGVDEAGMTARQFAGFTEEDLLNLRRGQALVRPEVRGDSFNLETFPPPAKPSPDPTPRVVDLSRQKYAKTKAEVEAAFTAPRPKPAPPPKATAAGSPPPAQAPPKSTGEVCPECGGLLGERVGPHGPFIGCSNFKAGCRFSRPKPSPVPPPGTKPQAGPPPQSPPQAASQPAGATCPQCGSPLVVRSGPDGLFIGCSSTPPCGFQPGRPTPEPTPPPAPGSGPIPEPDPAKVRPKPKTFKMFPKKSKGPAKPTLPPMGTGEGSLEDFIS